MNRIAVIGAGWAGVACAWQLTRQGFDVTVFESGPTLGGRARRVHAPWGQVDNGQHLLIGAYNQTLQLMTALGLDPKERFYRQDLRFQSLDQQFNFGYWDLPAPWHQLGVALGGRGLDWRDKLALLRLMRQLKKQGWRTPTGQTVAQLLQQSSQSKLLIERLWQPLCIAALNTPIDDACAHIFAAVLRDSLGAGRDSSQLLIPLKDMSQLWVQEALKDINYHTGTPIQRLQYDENQRLWLYGQKNHTALVAPFDHCVIATQVPPAMRLLQSLTATTPPQQEVLNALGEIRFNPIATLYLQPEFPWTLPTPMSLLFENREHLHYGQWVFNHAALPNSFAKHTISVVISDAAPLRAYPKEQVTDALIQQLKMQLPDSKHPLPPIIDSMLITEQRATFWAVPQLKRPKAKSPWPGIYFAADWVDSDYPAVLEGAVRSGLHTAQLISRSAAT
ncbi:MAG TPA: hydroxysqualene dehydroxylase HpnE [Paenalcaligenes sp.]|nr:hydroxysqualene dehydroxylase HpnE [Paenalcaligenes sp.]